MARSTYRTRPVDSEFQEIVKFLNSFIRELIGMVNLDRPGAGFYNSCFTSRAEYIGLGYGVLLVVYNRLTYQTYTYTYTNRLPQCTMTLSKLV